MRNEVLGVGDHDGCRLDAQLLDLRCLLLPVGCEKLHLLLLLRARGIDVRQAKLQMSGKVSPNCTI